MSSFSDTSIPADCKMLLSEPYVSVEILEDAEKRGYIGRALEKIEWLDVHVGKCTKDWGLREVSIMAEDEKIRPQWWDFKDPRHAVLFKLTWGGK